MISIIVLRSACCGIAAAAVSVPVAYSVLVWDLARREGSVFVKASIGPNGVAGFGLGWLMREHPVGTAIWLVAAFAIGFLLGWRVFARSRFPRTL